MKKKLPHVLDILDEVLGAVDIPQNLSAREACLFSPAMREPEDIDDRMPRCQSNGKICYPSAKKAKIVMRKRQKRGAAYLRAYLCPDCRSYHLTSKR